MLHLISTSGEWGTLLHISVVLLVFLRCVLSLHRNESVATFNELLEKKASPSDADFCHVMCCADEFENIRVRAEELDEVDKLKKEACPIKVRNILFEHLIESLHTPT